MMEHMKYNCNSINPRLISRSEKKSEAVSYYCCICIFLTILQALYHKILEIYRTTVMFDFGIYN